MTVDIKSYIQPMLDRQKEDHEKWLVFQGDAAKDVLGEIFPGVKFEIQGEFKGQPIIVTKSGDDVFQFVPFYPPGRSSLCVRPLWACYICGATVTGDIVDNPAGLANQVREGIKFSCGNHAKNPFQSRTK